MFGLSKVWGYISQKAKAAKETAVKNIIITATAVGAGVGVLVFYGLHAINVTVLGGAVFAWITSAVSGLIALSASAFLPIAIIVGLASSALSVLLERQGRVKSLEQQKKIKDTELQALVEENERLKTDTRLNATIVNEKGQAQQQESIAVIAEIEKIKNNMTKEHQKKLDDAQAILEKLEELRQRQDLADSEVNDLKQTVSKLHKLVQEKQDVKAGGAAADDTISELDSQPSVKLAESDEEQYVSPGVAANHTMPQQSRPSTVRQRRAPQV